MLDVSREVPEARPIVAAAGEVFPRHAGDAFVGLIPGAHRDLERTGCN